MCNLERPGRDKHRSNDSIFLTRTILHLMPHLPFQNDGSYTLEHLLLNYEAKLTVKPSWVLRRNQLRISALTASYCYTKIRGRNRCHTTSSSGTILWRSRISSSIKVTTGYKARVNDMQLEIDALSLRLEKLISDVKKVRCTVINMAWLSNLVV